MHRILRLAVIALLAGTACSKSGSSSSTPHTALTVTAEAVSGAVSGLSGAVVRADGKSVVRITVTGGVTGPIRVIARAGTFDNGKDWTTIAETSGSVALHACDVEANSRCVGAFEVSATDAAGNQGKTSVTFVGHETVCTDGKDDNGDGRTDCADPDCNDRACLTSGHVAGTCQSSVCTPASCTASGPEICTNGVDDDCDHQIDCEQATCDGQPCKAGSPSFVCQNHACTDAGSGFGLALSAARVRLPADGLTQTRITVTVKSKGAPASGAQVNLATDLGGFAAAGGATASTQVVSTDSTGVATATYVASATAGVAHVTATLAAVPQVTQSVAVTMPALGSIQLGAVQNQGVLGVKYSGWYEQNQLSVLLLDDQQQPYPDGLAVRFEHQQLGGSAISTPAAPDGADCRQADHCLAYATQVASPTDKPDTGGLAYVSLYSGTAAGLVSVKATAVAGGVSRSFNIQNLAIVGAKPSGAHMSLDCTPQNVPALIKHDCISSQYGGSLQPVQCTVHFADRFNNLLGRSLLATFLSEAGAAGQPVTTQAYDPKSDWNQMSRLGYATDIVAVKGYTLPADVEPLIGEPQLDVSASDVCGKTTANPRDGLVTVIVMAKGEEGFVDLNANGVWDAGEPFIDQGEPFVDANDDSIWEPGEAFVDLNGNNKYDGPNGIWDASATIWTEARVLYTGFPSTMVMSPPDQAFTPSTTEQTAKLNFRFADENGNALLPATTYAVGTDIGTFTASLLEAPTNVDNLGMRFSRQYCNHPPGWKPDPNATPPETLVCSGECKSSPCYVTTVVDGFAGGSYGTVLVRLPAGKTGSDTVHVRPTIEGVTVSPGATATVHAP